MSSIYDLAVLLLILVHARGTCSIPACIIIDPDSIRESVNETTSPTNGSLMASILRRLNAHHDRSLVTESVVVAQPVPLSHINIKQTTPPSQNGNPLSQKFLTDPTSDQSFSPCSIGSLDEIETQMVVPFEFRRLRIERPDHRTKYLDDDLNDRVSDLSTVVYERRSDPDGLRFCRACRDGLWTPLAVCETVRCDAELLRADPRLVTEWGEIKPLDGGALYAPSTVYAIYSFAFGPHCKRCESNGQWSRYALPDLCSDIKFLDIQTTTAQSHITSKDAQLKHSNSNEATAASHK